MKLRLSGPKSATVWISVEPDLYNILAQESRARNRTISNLLYSLISNATNEFNSFDLVDRPPIAVSTDKEGVQA